MPTTKGSRMSLSSQSSATTTNSVASQKAICRSKLIETPKRAESFRRVHVTHPMGHIEGDRQQGQGGDQRHERIEQERNVPMECERRQHHGGKHDLGDSIEL